MEGDEVVARVGVDHRAHPLGGLVDVAVVRVALAALEHQVLEEVGDAVLLRALGARAGVERDERVSARVPGIEMRWIGRPLGAVVVVIWGICEA